MPIRGATPLTIRPLSVCDAIDGSNVTPGSMRSLANLIPFAADKSKFTPRPAATQLSNFAGFTTPAQGEALIVIGTRAYGFIASGRFAGKSEPFCYDLVNAAFIAIAGATAANCPTTQSTVGDWTPPTMAMVANRLMMTHPGYDGATNFVGWIDMRSFTSTSLTGATHTSTLIDGLSANPITAGWQVGDAITGAGVQANTTIVSMTATSVTLSQAATATAAGVALTVTSGTKAAPRYGAGQTNVTPLAAVPVAVAQFNGRAYYAVKNGVQFSDALIATNITNATQQLTMGDDVAVNALAGLPLSNQTVGGIVQSLIAFKGDGLYYQVTGDPATNDLRNDAVPGSVGTLAPLTIQPTPRGLAYIAPDGLRFITQGGLCSDPVGGNGDGINIAFRYAINPSRMCAAYDKSVYRVSVQNGYTDGQPYEEYWYDFRGIWTGPHSFPAALIAAYRGGANAFVSFAQGVNAKLWQSKVQADASSTFTENGVALTWKWQTTLLPDNDNVASNQVVQTSIGVAMPASQAMTITALDEKDATIDTVALSSSMSAGSIWGSFTWGASAWGLPVQRYQQYSVDWSEPLVFKQMSLQIVGQSQAGFVIGNLDAEYQVLGYMGAH